MKRFRNVTVNLHQFVAGWEPTTIQEMFLFLPKERECCFSRDLRRTFTTTKIGSPEIKLTINPSQGIR